MPASSSMMVGALMFLIAGTQMVVMLPSALVPGISVPSFIVMMCSLKQKPPPYGMALKTFDKSMVGSM